MNAPRGVDGERATSERIVVLGRILGAFGVAGWLKVESYTDPPEGLLKYRSWLIRPRSGHATQTALTEARLVQGRRVGTGLHVQLEGVSTREHAAKLGGAEIGVRRGELPKLERNEFYWNDLIGLEAHSPDGEYLGEIAEIRAAPAHPLLRLVEPADAKSVGSKIVERWVPLVRERVRRVDLDARRVILDWRRDW